MSRSGSGRVTRAGGFAVFVVGLLAMVAALLAATPAWASSASNVSVRFRNPDQAPALVGAQTGYTVQLTSTSALLGGTQAGDHIALSVPAGTKFPTGSAVNSPYRLSTPRVGYNVNAAAIVSDVGATARIPLTGNASIEIRASDAVRLTVGIFENNVTNPTAAGSYRLGVATSRDTTPANSSPYTIGPNDPARVSAVAGASFARVGTGFLPLEAKVTDAHGNAVPSQGVTFAAPESGPSGTFASTGSATDAATTGVDGVATASAFTANTIAGAYQVRASSADLEPADLPATTTPGPAENLAVDLEPRFVVADGRSTTTATATVTDEHGNGVPFEDVSFSSGGGQQIG